VGRQQQSRNRPSPAQTENQPPLLHNRQPDAEFDALMDESASLGAAADSLTGAHDELEAEIESILSENPEEFVMRFVQTVGQ